MLIQEIQNPVKPRLFLCKPDRTTIAELYEAYGIEHRDKLGSISELQFKLPYEIELDHQLIHNNNTDLALYKYLIRLQFESGDEEWFVINSSSALNDEDTDYQEILCYSLMYELNDKSIKRYNPDTKNASYLLNEVLTETGWGIDYVNSYFDIMYRSPELSGSILSIVFDLATTFGAICIANTVNRTVSFYKPGQIGMFNGLTIDYGKYLKSLNKSLDFDTFCTRLKPYGKDSLTINETNITGSNYLENFSYFIDTFERNENKETLESSRYLSDGLCHAILDYNSLLESYKNSFQSLLTQKATLQNELTILQNELTVLDTELIQIQDAIDVKRSKSQPLGSLLSDESNKKSQIASKQQEISNKQQGINTVISDISVLGVRVRKYIPAYSPSVAYKVDDVIVNNSKIYKCIVNIPSPEAWTSTHWQYLFDGHSSFTLEQIEELNRFIIEKETSNSYIYKAADLLEWAKDEFVKINTPAVKVEIDIIDLMQFLDGECRMDSSKLRKGDIVHLYHDKFTLNIAAKIIEINRNYEDGSISLLISNVEQILKDSDKFSQIINSFTSTSNTVDVNKERWNQIGSLQDDVSQILNNTWESAKRTINAGVNESVLVNRRGITISDSLEPQKYIRLTHGAIGITSDGGNNYHQVIDSSGIYAERLIGQIIAGNDLTITNTNGAFLVNSTGVTINGLNLTITGKLPDSQIQSASTWSSGIANALQQNTYYNNVKISSGEGLVATRSDGKVKAFINATSGFGLQKFENNNWYDLIRTNPTSGDLEIKGTLTAGSIISNTAIQGGTISIGSGFSVNSSGILTASGANIQGTVNCNALYINGNYILSGSQINGYYVQGSTIQNLNANNITSGTISADRIDVYNLSAKRIIDTSNSNNIMYFRSAGSSGFELLVTDSTRWWSMDTFGGYLNMAYNDSVFLRRESGMTTLYGTVKINNTLDCSGASVTGLYARFA